MDNDDDDWNVKTAILESKSERQSLSFRWFMCE